MDNDKIIKMKQNKIEKKKAEAITELKILTSTLTQRAALAEKMGKSFGTDRDLYKVCGYPKNLYYTHYEARFKRQDIVKRIIKAPVSATWKTKPKIYETENVEEETVFEKAWNSLVKEKRIYSFFARADKLARLNNYSILLLGFTGTLENPVKKNSDLLYLTPYSDENASIAEYDNNTSSKRFSLPQYYNIKIATGTNRTQFIETKVHYSRVIHIAEDVLEDNSIGIPALECVYNRLQDLETILAGSSEMYWQGAFPGLAFNMDAEADPGTQSIDDIEDEIDNYVHNFRRYLRLQGIDVKSLAPNIVSPSSHVDTILKIIAGAAEIPAGELFGPDFGHLSSKESYDDWKDRVDERRTEYAEPTILIPFIEKMIEFGVLPTPKDFSVKWTDIKAINDKERAENAKTKAEALATYANTYNAPYLYPPEMFLANEMGLSPKEIKQIDLKKFMKKRENPEARPQVSRNDDPTKGDF